MNALSFGLVSAAYFNVSADGIAQPFDWVVGVLTMLFVDQKMMGLFSLLFGVGVVLFAERAQAKGRRVVWLSLWRFALLLLIGLAHMALWEGDVLVLYAICAPLVLWIRRLSPKVMLGVGTLLTLAGTMAAPFVQQAVGNDVNQLGDMWFTDRGTMSDLVGGWFLLDAVGRALGMMLVGVALYRLDIVQGQRDDRFYQRMATWGLGVGSAITAAGLVLRITNDWSPDHALIGHIPTGLDTIPMALGYLALIIRWNRRRGASNTIERVRNVGRMAMTNYLTQTMLGVVMLTWFLDDVDLSRTMIAAWILAVWALQYWWSTWWLSRFRYGPFEWAWRCGTYRSWQPLLRTSPG